MKTQKIKYKLPKTKYFSVEFPETITLSAGMSWTIPVTFRPVAKESYHDAMEFTTSFGKFNYPVIATLPEHVLEHPSTIDFALCPIREVAKKTFLLKNTGELSSYFEWDIQEPFSISKIKGILPPETSIPITVDFKPDDTSVYSAKAVCIFGDVDNWEESKETQVMKVEGMGKFSHFSVENKYFDIGEVTVDKSLEKKLVLKNESQVFF